MKRTIERLLFLLVGALIAASAYTMGNADHSATAQENITRFDTVSCKQLFIVNEDDDPKILLTTTNGTPVIVLKGKDDGHMLLEITAKGQPILSLLGQDDGAKVALSVKDNTPMLRLLSKEVVKEGLGNQMSLSVHEAGGFSASHLTNGRILTKVCF